LRTRILREFDSAIDCLCIKWIFYLQ